MKHKKQSSATAEAARHLVDSGMIARGEVAFDYRHRAAESTVSLSAHVQGMANKIEAATGRRLVVDALGERRFVIRFWE